MTRYEQLVDVAIPCVHGHFDYFEKCQMAAFVIAGGYADFLGFPRNQIAFVVLDQHLNRSDKTESFGLGVPMVFGDDGSWYFCFRIKYQKAKDSAYMDEYIRLGLKINGTAVTVCGDNTAEIDTASPKSFEEFFQHLFSDSLERFRSVPFQPSKRIGFLR